MSFLLETTDNNFGVIRCTSVFDRNHNNQTLENNHVSLKTIFLANITICAALQLNKIKGTIWTISCTPVRLDSKTTLYLSHLPENKMKIATELTGPDFGSLFNDFSKKCRVSRKRVVHPPLTEGKGLLLNKRLEHHNRGDFCPCHLHYWYEFVDHDVPISWLH